MNKELDQVNTWAIDHKILDADGFTQSYLNILNSYLKQTKPTTAILKSIKSYCYEADDIEIALLATFVTAILSTVNTPLGNYLKSFDRTLHPDTHYSKIINAVNQVKFDKENK